MPKAPPPELVVDTPTTPTQQSVTQPVTQHDTNATIPQWAKDFQALKNAETATKPWVQDFEAQRAAQELQQVTQASASSSSMAAQDTQPAQAVQEAQQSVTLDLSTMSLTALLDLCAELRARTKELEEANDPDTEWPQVFGQLTEVLTILDEKFGLTGRQTVRLPPRQHQ